MRRADRLFQIIQILRRRRSPVTAEAIAAELETSKRTIYRDIADLIGQRAPIRGEAGVGYVLDEGFDLPPLMLTADEVEAAVLGAQLVAQRGGDPMLARAAEDLIAKIAAVIPEPLRMLAVEPSTRAPRNWRSPADAVDMAQVRLCIRSGRKMALTYRDEQDRETRRTIWPFAVGYYETARLVLSWCEMRQAFRSFRTDRITRAEFLEERYAERPATLRAKWRRHQQANWQAYADRMKKDAALLAEAEA